MKSNWAETTWGIGEGTYSQALVSGIAVVADPGKKWTSEKLWSIRSFLSLDTALHVVTAFMQSP